uniref:Uncharacterized protein n=1 Tax=Arundo donax TaxID=35708 RepID=A0A0A9FW04_ARUDO
MNSAISSMMLYRLPSIFCTSFTPAP